VDKEFRTRRVHYDQALFLKRYFGVSILAMLRALREADFLEKPRYEEYAPIDPAPREKELFGAIDEGEPDVGAGVKDLPSGVGQTVSGFLSKFRKRPITSDRYKLLQHEAARKVAGEKALKKGVQKKLPASDE
jgi:hypothetical protein